MMKKTVLLILLAACCVLQSLGAENSPLFAPEPPDAGAAALVETYLPLLTAGEYKQALALNDMRGMRQYLLERRMSELKARNPELTTDDIQEMSVQVQLNDLNPARLQDVMLGVMKDADLTGLNWRIQGYAPAPAPVEGHLVSVETRTAEGKKRQLLLGLKKLGDQWMIAPYVVETIASRLATRQGPPPIEPPAEVLVLIETFWTHWQTGEVNEAYAMFSADYRSRTPLLAFLQQAQEFIDTAGVPAGWKVVKGVQTEPATFWFGVTVNGSGTPKPTLMQFRMAGDSWLLEDLQLQMPQATTPAGPPAAKASPFRSNLKPNLAPSLEPKPAPSAPPAEQPAEAPAMPTPAKPDAPIGPVNP